jgi:hypothetical protein
LREFLFPALFVAGVFGLIWLLGKRKWDRQARELLERRSNPSREEFVTLLADDADADVAEFLWDELLVYFKPLLTPHPDDNFIEDLPIDHDEPNDWLAGFCKANGLRQRDVERWPENLPSTVRNFAKWLSDERRRLAQR